MLRSSLPLALLALTSACHTEVAQTGVAVDGGMTPATGVSPDCSAVASSVPLPTVLDFGGGLAAPASPLLVDSYSAGVGPGLHVVARDVVRIYVNGRWVGESATARVPVFIPVTVLPGDNVITLVVSAAEGEPAALVHLDELTESVVSDASWRVSAELDGDPTPAVFDDSDWSLAVELGAFGTRPGCDPTTGFPENSTARWIAHASSGVQTLVFRRRFRIAPLGFGASTTGGGSAEPTLATNLDELEAALDDEAGAAVVLLPEGLLDLRPTGNEVEQQEVCPEPCGSTSETILHKVLLDDETCDADLMTVLRSDRRLQVGSNKTVVGLGRGAQLRGASFYLEGSQNVIFRNLAIYDVNDGLIEAGDGITFRAPRRVWLDHCTFKWISDGFTDLSSGTADITFSWLHYDGVTAAACTGHHPRASYFSGSTITVHHTFWDHVDGLAPIVDLEESRAHLFNNLVADNGEIGVRSACGAQVLLEGTSFEQVAVPTARTGCDDAPDQQGSIHCPVGSNSYGNDVGQHSSLSGETSEPRDEVFEPPYEYSVEPASEARPRVRERAGAGGIWKQPLVRD